MEHPILKELTNIRGKTMKRHGKVKGFRYVQLVSYDGEFTYRAEIPKMNVCKSFANVRDAAMYVDIMLLMVNKKAVNVLKKKN